jgi:hypothetical protein
MNVLPTIMTIRKLTDHVHIVTRYNEDKRKSILDESF